MNELANRPTTELAATPAGMPITDSVVQLQEWAAELSAARQLAQVLASSSFLPLALRQKSKGVFKTQEELTYDAAAVILAGKSVGLDPMQSVQNIFPVHGMPSMYARTMVALVIAQGHEVKRSSATDSAVRYSVRRKGTDDWQDFTWTIERAKKAGYTSNAKYVSDPIAMLGAKAAAEACRTVFPDILLGMAYSAEEIELEDMGEQPKQESTVNRLAEAAAAAEAEKPKQSASARLAEAAAPEPKREDVTPLTSPAPVEEQAETGEICTPEQWTHLTVALKAAGYATKPQMRSAVEGFLGRSTNGPEDLTTDEVARMQEHFTTLPAKTGDADQQWLDGVPA